MILFLFNVLLPNTIIWTLSHNKALWRLEITAMIGKIKKDLKHSGQCRQGRHWLKQWIFTFIWNFLNACINVFTFSNGATCYISIMYVSSIEFHIDTEITFCQGYHTQTTPNLIISCWVLAKYSFKINKVLIALLFFGLFILIIPLVTSLFLSLSWFAQGPWYCCYQVCLFENNIYLYL